MSTTISTVSILIVNLILLSSLVNCENTLKSLFVVHRHGDRTPVNSYQNDPYKDDLFWPDGWGMLTMAGKKRMYNIGVFLRNQYDDFLTDSIREVQVRSSDKDRCIESTQLVLNGAYKPKDRWVWETSQAWQPFPVHTLPFSLDSMLYPSCKCPSASQESAKIMNSNYVQSINKKYQNLYKYLTTNCGQTIDNPIQAGFIYDILVNEEIANYKVPVWVTPNVLKQLKELSTISFELLGYTRKIQKLRSGVFLYDLTKKIETAIKNSEVKNPDYYDQAPKKLNVYSTHDSFLTVLLAGLQINNGLPPPFGSTLIFELHEHNKTLSKSNWDESSSIKILYLNQTETNKPFLLKIPACFDTEICTVKQFISSITDLLVSPFTWNKECKEGSLLVETLQIAGNQNSFNRMEKLIEILY